MPGGTHTDPAQSLLREGLGKPLTKIQKKVCSKTSAADYLLWFSLRWPCYVLYVYKILYRLRLWISVQVRDEHQSSLHTEKNSYYERRLRWSIVKKRKAECSSKGKSVLLHMGQSSLSVPVWHKDQSSTIVPPINFSFWGKAAGCV